MDQETEWVAAASGGRVSPGRRWTGSGPEHERTAARERGAPSWLPGMNGNGSGGQVRLGGMSPAACRFIEHEPRCNGNAPGNGVAGGPAGSPTANPGGVANNYAPSGNQAAYQPNGQPAGGSPGAAGVARPDGYIDGRPNDGNPAPAPVRPDPSSIGGHGPRDAAASRGVAPERRNQSAQARSRRGREGKAGKEEASLRQGQTRPRPG